MSDIQPNGPWQPPAPQGAGDDEPFDDELFDGLLERSGVREGLPPTYRMRHDAHYVDQLAQPGAPPLRMVAIKDIDGARPASGPDLAPLITSIARFGLLQPLLVRRRNGRYDLIAGARRLAAAAAAGLSDVPCVLHDADESEARALCEASNTRAAGEDAAEAHQLSQTVVPASVLADLRQHLEAISSCINLLADIGDRPLRERVALQLMRVEAQRAAWLAAGLGILAEDPIVARAPVHLPALLEQVVRVMQAECALEGCSMTVAVEGAIPPVSADAHLLGVAFGGAVAAMRSLTTGAAGASVCCLVCRPRERHVVVVEIEQDAVTVPASRLARFFDVDWSERPGGRDAAIGIVAARRVAELHGGTVDVSAGDPRGCTLRLELPL